MTKINTNPLSGFMELSPDEQILFNEIKNIIEENFKLFGFIPMDNPLIERKEVLFTKAGGEIETQIYEIKKGDSNLALRFDLTVPLARYVANNYNKLTFPFKRYQIAKVYRGERSQAGRFREFYQADIDIIGDDNLNINFDAEIPAVIIKIFQDLNFGEFNIKINNRKIFNGFFKTLSLSPKTEFILRTIDKFEKNGASFIKNELKKNNIEDKKIEKILNLIQLQGKNEEIIKKLENLKIKDKIFFEGIQELKLIINNLNFLGINEKYFSIDLTIARGLEYYTGTIYETKLNDFPEIGSICSGGKYDNLVSTYINKKLPGVGMSIGLSRLFYQLLKKKKIKTEKITYTKILILPMNENGTLEGLRLVNNLRKNNISSEIDLRLKTKFTKRIKYADKLKIPFIVFIGENELKEKKYTIKNLITGEQTLNTFQEILEKIK